GDKPCTISTILAQQGRSIILRMPLQENEQALSVLGKNIGTCLGRSRQDRVTPRDERLLGQFIVTGMRNPPARRCAREDGMAFGLAAVKNPRKLFVERSPRDTIDM